MLSRLLLILAILWILPGGAPAALGQGLQTMPLSLVEGNRYVRQSFDENGQAETYQEIEISRLVRDSTGVEITLTLYTFDADRRRDGLVRTTIRCREQDLDMVMNLLAILRPEDRRIDLRVTGGEVLYPVSPVETDTLQDVTLDVEVQRGVLSFLGSKSRVHLANRSVRLQQVAGAQPRLSEPTYTVSEELHMRFYVLGIKVRERSYRVEETIAPGQGLVRQVLTAPDGSYIVLERVDGGGN